ncbi:MAG: glycosyltransferase family 2 protein, partial [Alteraurantiacibacter sp.]
TYRQIEWIVVDDASGPDYAAIFAAALEASPFPTRLITLEQNSRQAAARNRGVREAGGAYIKLLDSDDALDPDHIASLLAASEPGIIPFAPTRHIHVGSGKSQDNLTFTTVIETREAQLVRLLDAPFLHHSGALFPRDLLLELGPYDESLSTDEDGDLLLRTVMGGHLFRAVPEVRFLYRHHDTRRRVSADDELTKLEARAEVARKVARHFSEAIPPEVAGAIARRMDSVAVKALQHHPDFARNLLVEAEAIVPGKRSGGNVERTLRSALGIPASQAIMRQLRRIRGAS